jgi:colanic acid/amylovoran biosynthesis protein
MPAQNKFISLLRRVVSKSRRLVGMDHDIKMTTLGPGVEWFNLINSVNRRVLHNYLDKDLREVRETRTKAEGLVSEYSWKIALNALGAEWAHRMCNSSADLDALTSLYDRNIDRQGRWLTPIDGVEHAMKGYSLLYLAQVTGEAHYRQAAVQLAESLLWRHPRVADKSLPYDINTEALLVDTLAMICPFLARFSKLYGNAEALDLCVHQLKQFVLNNVDSDTQLPYHGYYASGPRKLGLHAWGRGTGWYMLGLIDTLVEMPQDHPDYAGLLSSFVGAAASLRAFQRKDGHWNWAILHKMDSPDSSSTSLIGYSILRAIQSGMLDESYRTIVNAAIRALVTVTRSDGVLDGSLAECRGLGKYPQNYQPTLWLQGSATAFAALLTRDGRKFLMDIVITGITGLHNRGVEALVTPIVAQTHKRIPACRLTVLTQTPEYDSLQIQLPLVNFKQSDFNFYASRYFRFRRKIASILGKKIEAEPQTEAANAIRSASVVVASGGDVFSSDYGRLQWHLTPLALAQHHNVPVVFLAQSIGPFRMPEEAEMFKRVAQQSSLITVRESLSYDYVTKELGLSTDIVKLTADPAFLLASPPPGDVEKMLKSYGIDKNRPVIAVAVSQGISQFSEVNYHDHFQAWQRLIFNVLETMKAQILLIPHVQTSSPGNDDRIIATNLIRSFNYNPDLHIAGANLSASEFKGLIGACDMVIAERMHSAIAGLSSGVCTVVVGYSVKAEGIMKDILGKELSQDFLIGIHDFVQDTAVFHKIQTAWKKRGEVKTCLQKVLPQVKARAESNFDLLVGLLK